MTIQYLGKSNPDGVCIGGSSDKVAFFGSQPVPQRSNPTQFPIQGVALGTIINWYDTFNPANVGANTTLEQAVVCTGMVATDFILGVTKPTANGAGIAGAIGAAANASVVFTNPTAANINLASESYTITAVRGMPIISANLSPANLAANATVEQIFTIAAANAAGTATVNAAGQVTSVVMTNAGSGYYVPPTVVFTSATPVSANVLTGTMAGLPGYQGGVGATGIAIIDGTGKIIGVQITNMGSGYTSAPTVSFIGGTCIAPGMVVVAQKGANQVGMGIGNSRVVAPNQIGLTFFNLTGANIAPTANEAYQIFAFNEMPAISPIDALVISGGTMAVANANVANTTAFVVEGMTANDVCIGVSPAALGANGIVTAGICSAANLNLIYQSAGLTNLTPANQAYTATIFRPSAPAPIVVYAVTLTPSNVANNVVAEQIFTLPANVTLQANSCVIVNKPSCTPGISIVGARANSTTTLGISFMNSTANTLALPVETYLVADFQTLLPPVSAGLSYCMQSVGMSFNQIIDLQNEVLQAKVSQGLMKGA